MLGFDFPRWVRWLLQASNIIKYGVVGLLSGAGLLLLLGLL